MTRFQVSRSGPDCSVVRMSASGAVGHRFMHGPCHIKGIKMVLATPLLTLATKGSARKIQEGRLSICLEYLLCRSENFTECIMSVPNVTLYKASLTLSLSRSAISKITL